MFQLASLLQHVDEEFARGIRGLLIRHRTDFPSREGREENHRRALPPSAVANEQKTSPRLTRAPTNPRSEWYRLRPRPGTANHARPISRRCLHSGSQAVYKSVGRTFQRPSAPARHRHTECHSPMAKRPSPRHPRPRVRRRTRLSERTFETPRSVELVVRGVISPRSLLAKESNAGSVTVE